MKTICYILLFCANLAFGQGSERPLLIDASEIESAASKALDEWIRSKDFSSFKSDFPKISGTLSYNLTVSGKGKIETVFMTESTITDVKFLNAFVGKLKKLELPFKMKKGERQKFSHSFAIQ